MLEKVFYENAFPEMNNIILLENFHYFSLSTEILESKSDECKYRFHPEFPTVKRSDLVWEEIRYEMKNSPLININFAVLCS